MTIYGLDILLSQFWTSLFVSCLVLTVVSLPAYRFLRRQIRWSGIPISFRIFHGLLRSTMLKAFPLSMKQKSMFSGIPLLSIWSKGCWQSFDFSKSSLYIWKFSVHILLKPSLKKFANYLVSMWNEHNCTVVCTFFRIDFLGNSMKTNLILSCGHCWVFQICWQIECNTLTASYFRIFKELSGNSITSTSFVYHNALRSS